MSPILMLRFLASRRLPRRSHRAGAAVLLLACALSGCAGDAASVADFRYDFGPPAPALQSGAHGLPALKVLDVNAPAMLDSTGLLYRLSYVDSRRTAAYAGSHWTMPPAQLLTQRLREALSARGTVLTGGDAVRAPVLKVTLDTFEQVFDSRTQSQGEVAARATLIQDGKIVGQQRFVARAPADTPDAAGGAQALASASDELVAQLVAWLGAQPLVAAR